MKENDNGAFNGDVARKEQYGKQIDDYRLLSRLQSDCKYFLGNGNRCVKHLWAKSVEKQIEKMRELYSGFAENKKPEWCTAEDIDRYEIKMNGG